MFWKQKLLQSISVLEEYKTIEPFSIHIKRIFKKNKQWGKRDRNQISDILYRFWRVNPILPSDINLYSKLVYSFFILHPEKMPDGFYSELLPGFNPDFADNITDRITILAQNINDDLPLDAYFPLKEKMSNLINYPAFVDSHFYESPVYAVIKNGEKDFVIKELIKESVPYEVLDNEVLKFLPQSKITQLQSFSKGKIWIQDISTYSAIKQFANPVNGSIWWDVCAGAGGKSIALMNINPSIKLYTSDNRVTILDNLLERFAILGIKKPKEVACMDVTQNIPSQFPMMDGIILDAPCSGSGTWKRNPENLSFFNPNILGKYTLAQRRLLENSVKLLKVGGVLLYITCSVYKEENEDIIEAFLQSDSRFTLQGSEYLSGDNQQGEYIFVSVLKKEHE